MRLRTSTLSHRRVNRPTRQSAPGLPLRTDTHVPYAVGVDEREVDRAAWAKLIDQLILSKSRGNKAAFARLVGVTDKTITRWLAHSAAVSEESVRQVARACDINAMDALISIGYYDRADIDSPLDEGEKAIMSAPVPDAIRQRMLARYRARMEEARQRVLAETEDDLRWEQERQRDVG